jgi:glycine/D-amino acid oxidase-like deaminating enzyme
MDGFTQTTQRLQRFGVNAVLLSGADLVKMEPNIAPDGAGGGYLPDDAQVNPLFATLALARAPREAGVIIVPFNEITSFEVTSEGKRVTAVLTTHGKIYINSVVLCVGGEPGLMRLASWLE